VSADLNILQNLSLECMKVENKQTEECNSNPDMVALGFISYMMEQFFKMQSQLMFQNFTATLDTPGVNVEDASQASNAVSILNSQSQANSMLGLYYGSVADTPVPVVTNQVSSPPVAGVPYSSIFGNSFAASNYGVPFPSTQQPGIMNAWLSGGGNYAVARDVASEIAYLQPTANRFANNSTLLSISDPNRRITSVNAYPSTANFSGVTIPASYHTSNNGTVTGLDSTGVELTTTKSSLESIITSVESRTGIRTREGKTLEDINDVIFSEISDDQKMNLVKTKEVLGKFYSSDSIELITSIAF
jgi:hypothetical protein